MQLTDILTPARTHFHKVSNNKKRVLQLISKLATEGIKDITPQAALDALISRERLGSTAIGHGVAIPHGRLAGIHKPIGVLVGLKEPIQYDDEEKIEVNLLIGLLIPKNDHETYLEAVAEVAKLFRRKSFRERLHHASSSEELYLIAIGANNAK